MTEPNAASCEARASEAVNALDWADVYQAARKRMMSDMTGGFFDQHMAREIADRIALALTDEAASQPRERADVRGGLEIEQDGFMPVTLTVGSLVYVNQDDGVNVLEHGPAKRLALAILASLPDTAPPDQAQRGEVETNGEIDLRPYGWAPGNYFITCIDCPTDLPIGERPIGAKRSCRCESHARAALAQSGDPS